MIEYNNICVSSNFDSGTFCNSFEVYEKISQLGYSCNIQELYSLIFEDFTALEILIASVVSKFLENKTQ